MAVLYKMGRLDLVWQYYFGITPLGWQYGATYAPELNKVVVNGVATGKTTWAAADGFLDCMFTPWFRYLNTSITAKQAELPFEMAMAWLEANPKALEHHVEDISLRPYPTIKFFNRAEAEYRTHGVDGRYIRGFEYDKANLDEAGYEFTGEVRKLIRTRLRGNRPDGTPRPAKLSLTTTPTPAFWLQEMFNKGVAGSETKDPEHRSWRVSTRQNTALSPQQIEEMIKAYSDIEVEIEIDGHFPAYGLTEFPTQHIHGITAEGQHLYDKIWEAVGSHTKGYLLEEHPRHGIVHYEVPAVEGARYMLAGDPGVGDPPSRNAGVLGVIRTDVNPSPLVYFSWPNGRGEYHTFLNNYAYACGKYNPEVRMMDTTGTQKALSDLLYERYKINVSGIHFGARKDNLLNYLITEVTDHGIVWPPIRGLINQMSIYKREEDKNLAQDIVMMLGMLAYGKRYRDHVEVTPGSTQRGFRR